MIELEQASWWDDEDDQEEEASQISEYDISAAPNDFNTLTMVNFIESGAVVIPGFQRHYVWDLKRASKLIESLIIGLPVPQIFLYEQGRNKFLVIDGQQRLMSLYYFVKQRFPRKEKRSDIRRIFNDKEGKLPPEVLHDDKYFDKFSLHLPSPVPNRPNRFHRLNYETLGEYRGAFDLRVIRNVMIKQNGPPDDDSSVYEIFNRLNSGGVNLTSQEIRASLYHSTFYDLLYRLNSLPAWRTMLGEAEPDLHLKDLEVLIRGFGLLVDGEEYRPSMTKFLNDFSRRSKSTPDDQISYLERLFEAFLTACAALNRPFHGRQTNKFNISTFDAVFAALAGEAFPARTLEVPPVDEAKLNALKADPEFVKASQEKTTAKANVTKRIERAKAILLG